MLINFFFDFETRSQLDVKKHGPVNYAMHPSTEATRLTFCFGNASPVYIWRRGEPLHHLLVDVVSNPQKYRFLAFNLMFDYLIWTGPFRRLVAPFLKSPPIENLEDVMATTCYFRAGISLDGAAQILKLPFTKHKRGRVLMLKQSKPNSKGEWVTLTPEEQREFEIYAVGDTELLRMTYNSLPPLPPQERWAWEWTFVRNLRGIRVDVPLIKELSAIINTALPRITQEWKLCTGRDLKINSPKCKEFFKPYYPYIENMRADTVRDMLADKNPAIPPHIRRALELKDLATSTSVSKIQCAQQILNGDRIYGLLSYAVAQTLRWAGRGIQIHNFPRPEKPKEQVDPIDFPLNVEDIASTVRQRAPYLKDPIDFVKNLLRRIWLPDVGKVIYCGDFSRVEPTVLFWLVGLGEIPPKWYEDMAATIYGVPVHEISEDSEERGVGKATNLGSGYGMGWEKFQEDTYKKTGIMLSEEMAKRCINAYRTKYKEVVALWKDLESAFRKAIYGETTSLCSGKVIVGPMLGAYRGVQIRLPSGGHLYYRDAAIRSMEFTDDEGKTKARQVLTFNSEEDGRVVHKVVYGGLLTEHVTSATARDILVPAMWRLEQAGFEVLTTVHDEVWGQSYPGRDQEFNYIMCQLPSWCPDIKISADLKVGVRYLK